MSKARKKRAYVPHKNQQRLREKIRASTWFAGGSWQENVATICGNFEYPHLLSPQLAKQFINQKNAWSCLLVAFMNGANEQWIKAEQLTNPALRQHIDRTTAEHIIQPELERFRDEQNARHIISVSWFMVPVPDVDLLSQRSAIADLLESEGAANKLLCELAYEQRAADIDRLEAERIQNDRSAA